MIDLTTTYLGLELKNPLVASSSPLSKKLDTVKKMEDAELAPLSCIHYSKNRSPTKAKPSITFWNWEQILTPKQSPIFPKLEDYNIGPEGCPEPEFRRSKNPFPCR